MHIRQKQEEYGNVARSMLITPKNNEATAINKEGINIKAIVQEYNDKNTNAAKEAFIQELLCNKDILQEILGAIKSLFDKKLESKLLFTDYVKAKVQTGKNGVGL